jgi:hypothetical protein
VHAYHVHLPAPIPSTKSKTNRLVAQVKSVEFKSQHHLNPEANSTSDSLGADQLILFFWGCGRVQIVFS